jgi:hypothetical protein
VAKSTAPCTSYFQPPGPCAIGSLPRQTLFASAAQIGFIKDATGSFSLALVPLVVLAAASAVAILLIGRSEASIDLTGDPAVTVAR